MEKNDTLILSLDSPALVASVIRDVPPVAILNEQSTTYGRLTFCKVAADGLFSLAEFSGHHSDHDIRGLADMFTNQLQPLVAMLEHLVNDAKPANGGAA